MEKCLFVYNPFSGRGKIAKKEKQIVSMLETKFEVDVVVSEYAGHIGDIVKERGEKYDLIVVSGGDGTLNEIVNSLALLSKKPRLGYIPTGTVNDVAHSLYIPRNIKKAVKNILEGQVYKHDIFRMNDRYGIYVCCAGLFTETSYATNQKAKKKIGKIAYAFHGLKKIFVTPSVNLKLTYDQGEIDGKFAFMLFLNSRSVAGMRINRRALLNDGLIDVILVRSKKDIVNIPAIARVALLFIRGVPKKSSKGIEFLRLNKFTVATSSDTIINLDGEKIGAGSFEFEVIRQGVDIIVPNLKKLKKNTAK